MKKYFVLKTIGASLSYASIVFTSNSKEDCELFSALMLRNAEDNDSSVYTTCTVA